MPNKCSVLGCRGRGGFSFPTDPEQSLEWQGAIKRDKNNESLWKPSPWATVCESHFKTEDFKESYVAAESDKKRRRVLKSTAVPSVFAWSESTESSAEAILVQEKLKMEFPEEATNTTKFMDQKSTKNQRPYPCPICSQSLHSLDAVYGHLRDSHGYVGEVFLCRLCHYMAPKRSMWLSHYSECTSFNHLMCPEPGCDYVSEERKEIERHMMCDHTSVTHTALKLFFCPTCSQSLELETKEEYEQHISLCNNSQILPSLSIEIDEATQEPSPQPVANEAHNSSWDIQRPKLSYSQMIAEVLNQAEDGMMPLSDILTCITQRYPSYRSRMDVKGWQNAIRHTLSVSQEFHKVPRSKDCKGRGHFWTMKDKAEMQILEERRHSEKTCTWCRQENSEKILAPNIIQVSEKSKNLEIIKCDRCDFRLGCKYPSSGYSPSLRRNVAVNMSKHYREVHNIQEKRSVTNSDFVNPPCGPEALETPFKPEALEKIKCHLCELSLLDTEPSHPMNNGRRRMRQHYSMIHKIRHMRLCEKRGCEFRSASSKLNRKHRIEEAGLSQCEICGHQILAVNLERHKKEIHGDLTFDCDYCGRPYADPGHLRKHLFKHHGKEAYGKFVEERHKKYKKKRPGICQVCGEYVDDQRVHLIAWHPEISAPNLWKNDLTKGIRKLSQKPRWAERLNKRQKVLREQGKLPPTTEDGTNAEKKI